MTTHTNPRSTPRCLSLPLLAITLCLAPSLYAGDGIVASHANGRKIFVNNEVSAPGARNASAPATRGRLVYWSQLERRWKAVPPPSRTAMRNARSAVQEINALVAQLEASDPASKKTDNAAPDTRALTSGKRVSQPEIDAAIAAAAARHKVDVNLVRSLIKVESNFNPRAVSRKGAIGLMQLMPGTARDLKVNPYDVDQNVEGGVRHLKGLLNNFGGDVTLSLAAYNAGAGAVARHDGVPPYRETREYVKKINALYGTQQRPAVVDTTIRATRDPQGRVVFTND
ncbi:MAG: lytic transglycosylase domain-containing protein [Terriglobales bacterium]